MLFRPSLRPSCPRLQLQARRYMTRSHGHPFSHEPVSLSYTSYIPDSGNETEGALVILHGLFGSKRNWGSICKALHKDMPQRPIYALDLRNHGLSPHSTPMTYEAMAADVHKFIQDKDLRQVALLGHSMGGKVAMSYALAPKDAGTDPLSQLIVLDIAPSIGPLSQEFQEYIDIMRRIEALPFGAIKTRSDADRRMQPVVPDLSVRQFLLTNLLLPSNSQTHGTTHSKAKFIVGLDTIAHSISSLGSFPYAYDAETTTAERTWDGPTLAIKGKTSAYINHKNLPAFRAFFPDVRMAELDAGHWVHAEKPTEFRKLVVDFLENQ